MWCQSCTNYFLKGCPMHLISYSEIQWGKKIRYYFDGKMKKKIFKEYDEKQLSEHKQTNYVKWWQTMFQKPIYIYIYKLVIQWALHKMNSNCLHFMPEGWISSSLSQQRRAILWRIQSKTWMDIYYHVCQCCLHGINVNLNCDRKKVEEPNILSYHSSSLFQSIIPTWCKIDASIMHFWKQALYKHQQNQQKIPWILWNLNLLL